MVRKRNNVTAQSAGCDSDMDVHSEQSDFKTFASPEDYAEKVVGKIQEFNSVVDQVCQLLYIVSYSVERVMKTYSYISCSRLRNYLRSKYKGCKVCICAVRTLCWLYLYNKMNRQRNNSLCTKCASCSVTLLPLFTFSTWNMPNFNTALQCSSEQWWPPADPDHT